MNEPNKRLGKNVGAAHRHGLSLSVRVGLASAGLLLGVKTVYDVNRGWSYGRYRISGFDRHDVQLSSGSRLLVGQEPLWLSYI